MQFSSFDVNAAIMKMLKPDSSGDALLPMGKSNEGGARFQEKLSALLAGGKLNSGDTANGRAILKKIVSEASISLDKASGKAFLEELKDILMMVSDGDLTSLFINRQGIDALAGLLSEAGFDKEQIAELMADIKADLKEKGDAVSLSDILHQVSAAELKSGDVKEEETGETTLIDNSYRPFFKSIMTSLRIPVETQDQIMSKAMRAGGIDLDAFIENLQSLSKHAYFQQYEFKSSAEDRNLTGLLDHLGLQHEISAKGEVTLQHLIEAFERLRGQQAGNFAFSKDFARPNADGFLNVGQGVDDFRYLNSRNSGTFTTRKGFARPNADGFLNVGQVQEAFEQMARKHADNSGTSNGWGKGSSEYFLNIFKNNDSKNPGMPDLKFLLGAGDTTDAGQAAHGGNNGNGKTGSLLSALLGNVTRKDTNKAAHGTSPGKTADFSHLSSKEINKLFFAGSSRGGESQAHPASQQAELESKLSLLTGELKSGVTGKINGGSKGVAGDGSSVTGKESKSGGFRGSDTGFHQSGGFRSADTTGYLSGLKSKPSFRNLPSYMTNQIGKSIVRAVNRGESELRIQLKPPELGRLIMTIDSAGDSMRISVMAEKGATKDMLILHATDLKSALANSGINLDSFDVNMGGDFRQAMADPRFQSGFSQGKGQDRQGGNTNGSDSNEDGEANEGSDPEFVTRDGTFHYVA